MNLNFRWRAKFLEKGIVTTLQYFLRRMKKIGGVKIQTNTSEIGKKKLDDDRLRWWWRKDGSGRRSSAGDIKGR